MTPHNQAQSKDIAKTVLMPGDPLRAKFIADNFLENVREVNHIRNMLMYTGTYKGQPISICGSGMGQPSIGIYSYELFTFYDVDNIIRIGSAGSYQASLNLHDVVLATEAYSDSKAFNQIAANIDSHVTKPTKALNQKIKENAQKLNIPLQEVRVHSSDVFYAQRPLTETIKITQAACVEMEAGALFANALFAKKNAACLLTISDNLITKKATTAQERQKAFTNMIKIALELAQ